LQHSFSIIDILLKTQQQISIGFSKFYLLTETTSQKKSQKKKINKNTIDINITHDGGQAIGEEMRHVQVSR